MPAPLNTFPLPDSTGTADAAAAGLAANSAVLDSVIAKAYNATAAGIAKNGAQTQRVTNKVGRAVTTGLASNNENLAPVETAALTGATVGVMNQGQILDGIAMKANPPQPADLVAPAAPVPVAFGPGVAPADPNRPIPPGAQPGGIWIDGPNGPIYIGGPNPAPGVPDAGIVPPLAPAPVAPGVAWYCVQAPPTALGPGPITTMILAGGVPPTGMTIVAGPANSAAAVSLLCPKGPVAPVPPPNPPFPTNGSAPVGGIGAGASPVSAPIGAPSAPGEVSPPASSPSSPATPEEPEPTDTCPVTNESDCGPSLDTVTITVWDESANACDQLFDQLGIGTDVFTPAVDFLKQVMTPSTVDAVRAWVDNPQSCPEWAATNIVKPALNAWSQFGSWVLDFITTGKDCTSPTALNAAMLLAGYGALKHFTGIELKDGTTQAEYMLNSQCPTYIPNQGEIDSLYVHNWISHDDWACLTGALNNLPNIRDKVVIDQRPWISLDDTYLLGRRGLLPDPGMATTSISNYWLNRVGVSDALTNQAIIATHYWYPSVEQTFAAVDDGLTSETYFARWGLDATFAAGNNDFTQKWLDGNFVRDQDALTAYAMGWTQPSPGEAQEWLYRLRPGADGVTTPCTMQDYMDVVGLSERSALVEQWKAQVAYRPLTTSDARALYQWGVSPSTRIYDAYLDAGYKPTDAGPLAARDEVEATRARAQQTGGWTIGRVADLIRMGLASLDQAGNMLAGQGYTNAEITTAAQVAATDYAARLADRSNQLARRKASAAALAAYKTGTIAADQAGAALASAGFTPSAAQAMLAATDAAAQAATAEKAVSAIRGAYLRGAITLDQLQSALSVAGIVAPRLSAIVAEAQVAFAMRSPVAGLAAIKGWVAKGYMSEAQARQRLVNLGYKDPDLLLYLDDMEAAVLAADAKAEQALDKQGRAAAKAASDATKAADAAKAKAVAASKRNEPLSLLKASLKAGYLTIPTVASKLHDYGYSDDAIDLLVANWLKIDPTAAAAARQG